MKHSFLDQYSGGDSLIHRLDPRTKLVTTMLFILAVTLTSPAKWGVFLVYFLVMATWLLLSRIPILYVLRRSLVIIPFVLVIAIFIPFLKGDAAGSYNIWLWQVSVTNRGLETLWNILAKAWLSVLSLILLTSATRMSDLLVGMERLRVPRVMVMILSFMYRYIFVLVDEAMRMKMARDSRSFGGGRLWHLRTIGNMAGTLFIRSYERGERVYAAMIARGFDGQCRTLSRPNLGLVDILLGVSFSLLVILTCVYNFVV